MRLVDTHCHLDNEKFDIDKDVVLKRIKSELEFCINIGYDLQSSIKSVELSDNNSFIYAVVGVHPTDISTLDSKVLLSLENLAKNPKVVAIGEIGLDYYWMTDSKEIQQQGFKLQLKLAEKLNKPVVIHTRDAMEDTVKILNEYPKIRGVLHCYSGSFETASILSNRFYFGIGGTLTFKNSKKLKTVIEKIPIDKIVIETDSPYLTPEPFRGKRNEPIYVKYVAQKIAEIKNISLDDVIKITTENAKKLYDIK